MRTVEGKQGLKTRVVFYDATSCGSHIEYSDKTNL